MFRPCDSVRAIWPTGISAASSTSFRTGSVQIVCVAVNMRVRGKLLMPDDSGGTCAPETPCAIGQGTLTGCTGNFNCPIFSCHVLQSKLPLTTSTTHVSLQVELTMFKRQSLIGSNVLRATLDAAVSCSDGSQHSVSRMMHVTEICL